MIFWLRWVSMTSAPAQPIRLEHHYITLHYLIADWPRLPMTSHSQELWLATAPNSPKRLIMSSTNTNVLPSHFTWPPCATERMTGGWRDFHRCPRCPGCQSLFQIWDTPPGSKVILFFPRWTRFTSGTSLFWNECNGRHDYDGHHRRKMPPVWHSISFQLEPILIWGKDPHPALPIGLRNQYRSTLQDSLKLPHSPFVRTRSIQSIFHKK